MDTCALGPEHLTEILRNIWGASCQLQSLEDLNDGFAKKTYLLQVGQPDTRCILHIWAKPEHQLTEVETDADWILGSNGSEQFGVNNTFLRDQGVPTPEVYALDSTKSICEYDFALVEYIEGGNFTEFTQQCDADTTHALLWRINEQLEKMHGLQAPRPGLLTQKRPSETRCERLVWQHTRLELDLACDYNEAIKSHKAQILDALESLVDVIEPRSVFSLIHGELGPEHILVSPASEPYFIDCEGARFFDLEYEHSLLRARFRAQYSRFARTDLDRHRMKFYTLTHSIGWAAFASEAVTRDSINRDWATGIMTSNTHEIIRLVCGSVDMVVWRGRADR